MFVNHALPLDVQLAPYSTTTQQRVLVAAPQVVVVMVVLGFARTVSSIEVLQSVLTAALHLVGWSCILIFVDVV